jgi:superoxide dismutase, Cu-Zn family
MNATEIVMRNVLLIVCALPVAACVPAADAPQTATGASAARPVAMAILRDTAGAEVGQAQVFENADSLRITLTATGLGAGEHGLHIHAVGKCEAPGFTSAGPHWNPTTKQHGRDNPMGAHHGDLPNIVIGADGRGSVDAPLPGTRAEMLDADGAAIIIHAGPDDYKTDPTGNSGGRIACGVFTAG